MVFTKSDKLSKNTIIKNLDTYREEMLKSWEELPQIFVTSAEKGTGRDELLDFISGVIKNR